MADQAERVRREESAQKLYRDIMVLISKEEDLRVVIGAVGASIAAVMSVMPGESGQVYADVMAEFCESSRAAFRSLERARE